MKTVWKFGLPVQDGDVLHSMPKGAEVLQVREQGEQGCLWALVDDAAEREDRRFVVCGTGHPAPEDGRYLGTFQLLGGRFIGHVFER